jgi:hypothetical protein
MVHVKIMLRLRPATHLHNHTERRANQSGTRLDRVEATIRHDGTLIQLVILPVSIAYKTAAYHIMSIQ